VLDEVLAVATPERVLVVVPQVDDARSAIAAARGARIAGSPDATRGMRWSIHTGFDATGPDASGVAIVLGDDPLAARMLATVLQHAGADPSRPVAVRRRVPAPHPVYLPRATWPTPPATDDDRGLRALLDGADVDWIDAPDAPSLDVDDQAVLVELARRLRP
jgi:CTP:molybdopterin cytidylyltransferase MocA